MEGASSADHNRDDINVAFPSAVLSYCLPQGVLKLRDTGYYFIHVLVGGIFTFYDLESTAAVIVRVRSEASSNRVNIVSDCSDYVRLMVLGPMLFRQEISGRMVA